MYTTYTPVMAARAATSWPWLAGVRSTSKEVIMMEGVTTYSRIRDTWDKVSPDSRPSRPNRKPADISRNRVRTLPPTTENASSIGSSPLFFHGMTYYYKP